MINEAKSTEVLYYKKYWYTTNEMDSINIRTLIVYTQRMYIEYRKKKIEKKSQLSESNRWPSHYKCDALTSELSGLT